MLYDRGASYVPSPIFSEPLWTWCWPRAQAILSLTLGLRRICMCSGSMANIGLQSELRRSKSLCLHLIFIPLNEECSIRLQLCYSFKFYLFWFERCVCVLNLFQFKLVFFNCITTISITSSMIIDWHFHCDRVETMAVNGPANVLVCGHSDGRISLRAVWNLQQTHIVTHSSHGAIKCLWFTEGPWPIDWLFWIMFQISPSPSIAISIYGYWAHHYLKSYHIIHFWSVVTEIPASFLTSILFFNFQ